MKTVTLEVQLPIGKVQLPTGDLIIDVEDLYMWTIEFIHKSRDVGVMSLAVQEVIQTNPALGWNSKDFLAALANLTYSIVRRGNEHGLSFDESLKDFCKDLLCGETVEGVIKMQPGLDPVALAENFETSYIPYIKAMHEAGIELTEEALCDAAERYHEKRRKGAKGIDELLGELLGIDPQTGRPPLQMPFPFE